MGHSRLCWDTTRSIGHEFVDPKDMKSIQAFQSRKLAILCDESSASRRAVLVAPAQDISAQHINTILTLSGGLNFVAVSPTRANSLMLSRMARPKLSAAAEESPAELDLCVSVEAREGVSTGISAADRATTIAILGEQNPNPRKLVMPGHIFPVTTREGGVLVRNTLPEGALDLVTISGYSDAALFLDLLDSNGELATPQHYEKVAADNEIPLLSLSDIIHYRLETEKLVTRIAEAKLPSSHAQGLRSIIYRSDIHNGEHLALVKGEIDPDKPTLTRVQSEFTFADVFGGKNPPTRHQLQNSLHAIEARGSGVVVYLRQASAGKLKEQVMHWQSTYQQKPAVTMREYGFGAQILRDLGVRKIELLTNSKKDLVGLKTFGIEIVSQIPIPEQHS